MSFSVVSVTKSLIEMIYKSVSTIHEPPSPYYTLFWITCPHLPDVTLPAARQALERQVITASCPHIYTYSIYILCRVPNSDRETCMDVEDEDGNRHLLYYTLPYYREKHSSTGTRIVLFMSKINAVQHQGNRALS